MSAEQNEFTPIPCEIARLVISETQEAPTLVMLREKDGERTLTIGIHIVEAIAINRKLSDEELPRPMTHDLLVSVIEHMGGALERVVVNDLRVNATGQGTYYALLFIRMQDGREVVVDSRPSDGLSLAVRVDCPIYVADHVFDLSAD